MHDNSNDYSHIVGLSSKLFNSLFSSDINYVEV